MYIALMVIESRDTAVLVVWQSRAARASRLQEAV
jgi:hypothetical protein